MRFHTSHLLGFVSAAAFLLALIQHPEALCAAGVALLGGLFVVLPVLGTIELLAGRDSATPHVDWMTTILVFVISLIGMVLAAACLFALV